MTLPFDSLDPHRSLKLTPWTHDAGWSRRRLGCGGHIVVVAGAWAARARRVCPPYAAWPEPGPCRGSCRCRAAQRRRRPRRREVRGISARRRCAPARSHARWSSHISNLAHACAPAATGTAVTPAVAAAHQAALRIMDRWAAHRSDRGSTGLAAAGVDAAANTAPRSATARACPAHPSRRARPSSPSTTRGAARPTGEDTGREGERRRDSTRRRPRGATPAAEGHDDRHRARRLQALAIPPSR